MAVVVMILIVVAVTAVARELIVYDYAHAQGETLAGIAAVMVGIAAAYFFVKNAESTRESSNASSLIE